MSDDVPDLIDVHEAARYLRISVSKLYELTRARELRHYRNGRRIFFSKSMLAEFLKKTEITPVFDCRNA